MKFSIKSRLRRWLALLLTLCLLFSSVPASLAAEEEGQPTAEVTALVGAALNGAEELAQALLPEGEGEPKPDETAEVETPSDSDALTEPELEEALDDSEPARAPEEGLELDEASQPLQAREGEEAAEAEARPHPAVPVGLSLTEAEAEEARQALGAQLERVTGANAACWYQADDRFNGREACQEGFWAQLQPVLAAAQELYDNPSTTAEELFVQVDQLAAAVDKLIPVSCANATLLYEAVQEYSQHIPAPYTADSWALFSQELETAQALLASLFEDDGMPSSENTAAKQPKIEAALQSLTQAADNLLAVDAQKTFDHYAVVYRSTAQWLMGQTDLREGDYTPESWNTWLDARQELAACISAGCGSNNKITAYIRAISAASMAYYSLEARQQAVTVHVRVADSFSLIHPDYALSDENTRTYDGSLVLSGDKTVGALLQAMAFSKNQVEQYYLYSPKVVVYINGIMAVNREKTAITDWMIDTDGSPQLHDGDQVVIAVVDPPAYCYYVNYIQNASYDSFYSYAYLLQVEDVEDVLELEAGQTFEVSVSKTTAAAEAKASCKAAAGVEVFLSTVQQSAEAARSSVADKALGVTTNQNGKAQVTCYSEGWYRLAVADVTAQTAGSVSSEGFIGGGKYDNLAVSDYVLLHVIPAEDDSPIRVALQRELDELYASYDRGFFTADQWQAFDSCYKEGSRIIAESTLLGAAYSAQAEALSDMRSLVSQTQAEHERQKLDLEWYMGRLPDRADDFTACFTEKFEGLMALVGRLSPYMLGQMTQGQQAKYALLLDTYNQWGGQLPQDTTYQVTLLVEGADNRLYSGYHQYKQSYRMQMYTIPGQTISDSLAFTADGLLPGEMFAFTIYDPTVSLQSDWPELQVLAITAEGTEDLICYFYDDFRQGISNVQRYYNASACFVMPSCDVTLHVKVGAVPPRNAGSTATADLASRKQAALLNLEDLLATYAESDYSPAEWASLLTAKEEGADAICSADSEEALTAAKQEALDGILLAGSKGLLGLPDYGDPVGRVYVSLENTTYPEGNQAFAYYLEFADENVFVAGWYDLCQQDTMMTIILKALKTAGLSWVGTGGDEDEPYSITYLSAIYFDVNENGQPDEGEPYLAEFTGGPDSGWMGTLNDWFTNYGFQIFTVEGGDLTSGDSIQVQYTRDLGADIFSNAGENNTQLAQLEVQGGELSPAFEKGIYSYTLLIPKGDALVKLTPTAENKNFQVKAFLNQYNEDSCCYSRNQTIPVSAGDVIYLGCGEYAWPSMNKTGFGYTGSKYTVYVVVGEGEALDKRVEQLPAVKDVSYSNHDNYQALIQELYADYSTLTDAEREALTNRGKLLALKEKADRYAAVDEVKAALATLPSREDWTEGDKATLRALLDAYQALPEADRLDCMTVSEGEQAAAMEEYLKAVNYGDLNGDGYINLKDIILLKRYVAHYSVEIDAAAADVNADGYINLKDIILLKRFVANFPVTLGKQA